MLTLKRTLEEMDQYFKDSHWFVPLSKTDRVGSKDRERDLAMGESAFILNVTAFTDHADGEKVSNAMNLTHDEYHGSKA
jgi:hypothetical protein